MKNKHNSYRRYLILFLKITLNYIDIITDLNFTNTFYQKEVKNNPNIILVTMLLILIFSLIFERFQMYLFLSEL